MTDREMVEALRAKGYRVSDKPICTECHGNGFVPTGGYDQLGGGWAGTRNCSKGCPPPQIFNRANPASNGTLARSNSTI